MKVIISGALRAAAGGHSEFEVAPGTINQILARLAHDHPVLQPLLEEGVSVAVDGVVYRSDFTREVAAGSEVILLTPIVGG